MDVSKVKALVFDVFGTVVDWRRTVVAELSAFGAERGWVAEWGRFADRWRLEGYIDAMKRVNDSSLPWLTVDELHRIKLEELLAEHGFAVTQAELAHLVTIWHRLEPFPDAVEGIGRLKRHYLVATLSNGNMALLTNMAKRAGLPWDCVLSAELFRRYKPDPVTYRGAAAFLGCAPEEVMLVASHTSDLEGARRAGLATAFVGRPEQWGIGGPLEPPPESPFEVMARDFLDLDLKLRMATVPAFGTH